MNYENLKNAFVQGEEREAASPQRIFDQVVSGIEQGLPVRGSSRAVKGSISKSEASRM